MLDFQVGMLDFQVGMLDVQQSSDLKVDNNAYRLQLAIYFLSMWLSLSYRLAER